MDRELLKGSLDIILLSLLSKQDMYGYEISKTIKNISAEELIIGEGTLYPSLKRLEDNTLLESYFVKLDNKSIKRKYYKITILGVEKLNEKLNEFNLIRNIINTSLLREEDL